MVKQSVLSGVLLILFLFAVYFVSASGTTPFNHFSLLADAFIGGKFYVTLDAPWLEKVPIDPMNFFVPYPPMPAILLLPFRILLKNNFPQDYLGYILAAAAALFTVAISQVIKKDIKLGIWSGALAGLGTIVWYMASVGSSWYLGQLCAYFFLLAAIYESISKKRYFLIGALLGASYLSRIETIVSLPFFLYLSSNKNWFRNYTSIALGILPFMLFNFYYNFSRFGVIWDKAYALIPGVDTEHWYNKGIIHPSYIPRHLKIIFTGLPEYLGRFPYFDPGIGGLAIWFTTPAFIYALFAGFKDKVVKFSWLAIFLISLIIFSHGSTGFAQFGYRFAVDFYPFLIFLTIKGAAKTGIRWHHWTLLLLGVLVNLWGILWFRYLNQF